MPLTSPAYPMGPYRFVNREFFIISYRTDPDRLRAVVPEPLQVTSPIVNYEFIRMPDSTGFGDYTESGQVIPVQYKGQAGNYTHAMYLDDHPPLAGGRELWGFPKKLAQPKLHTEIDTLVGTLGLRPGAGCDPARWATSTTCWTHRRWRAPRLGSTPNYLLKIIPHVDGRARICELVCYYLEDVNMKGAWEGPSSLSLVAARAGTGGGPAGARGAGRQAFRGRPDAGFRKSGVLTISHSAEECSMDLKGKSAIVTGRRERHRQKASPNCWRARAFSVAIADVNLDAAQKRGPPRSAAPAARRSAWRWTSPTRKR